MRTYLNACAAELDSIPTERRESLGRVASFIRDRRAAGEAVRLMFLGSNGDDERRAIGYRHFAGMLDLNAVDSLIHYALVVVLWG
jgi:hypothetical protein